MRNELITDNIGRTTANRVLVEVVDTFDGFLTKKGIHLVNSVADDAWGDAPGYNISEFIPRSGKVMRLPKVITCGSFGYNTVNELRFGDIVYWNLTSFQGHQPIVFNDRKFLLVDYHEILLRVRDEIITPINGYCIFTAIAEETIFGGHTVVRDKTNKWKLTIKPQLLTVPLKSRNYIDDIWSVGDIVYLSIMDKPFKIEGDITRNFDTVLYAAPLNMILCEV